MRSEGPGEAPPGAEPWSGTPATVGTVAVVGLGKIGVPLAARYAAAGWRVIGVDVQHAVIESFRAGRSHIGDEPGVDDALAAAHEGGRLAATSDHAKAASESDVVVMIVPVMLTDEKHPDYGWMDRASEAVARGLRPGTLVVYETTLPVGDTRQRFGPMLERESGLRIGNGSNGIYLAFSPERVFSGRVLEDLATYPKLVGGIDPASTQRALAFYESVLDAEVWDLGSVETAEFAKLAETTYRDVNIALANELASYADEVGVDFPAAIQGANSQPYSHLHEPGIGVGGHCIPVYPHFLLSRAPSLRLVEASRLINDGQVAHAVATVEDELGTLAGVSVLVLGLTYRHGVHELAYSRGPALVAELLGRGASVRAYDPLLADDEIKSMGASLYTWGEVSNSRVIMTQTADPRWLKLDHRWFPDLALLYDGRNSLTDVELDRITRRIGVGRGELRDRRRGASP